MENYDHIIEGMLYIRGDEGLDIKEISVVLEVSKKKATELMDEFIEKYQHHTLRPGQTPQTRRPQQQRPRRAGPPCGPERTGAGRPAGRKRRDPPAA